MKKALKIIILMLGMFILGIGIEMGRKDMLITGAAAIIFPAFDRVNKKNITP